MADKDAFPCILMHTAAERAHSLQAIEYAASCHFSITFNTPNTSYSSIIVKFELSADKVEDELQNKTAVKS